MNRVQFGWFSAKTMDIVNRNGAKAVRDCANFLLEESKKQVPHDTGALERSGMVDSAGLEATVSYDTPYAVICHERSANYQRGRKKKYLEDPVNNVYLQYRMSLHMQRLLEF
jgi:hypothetical protein